MTWHNRITYKYHGKPWFQDVSTQLAPICHFQHGKGQQTSNEHTDSITDMGATWAKCGSSRDSAEEISGKLVMMNELNHEHQLKQAARELNLAGL